MNQAMERIDKLKNNLIPRSEALKSFAPFDLCKTVSVGGGAKTSFKENDIGNYIFKSGSDEFVADKSSIIKLSRIVGIPESYVEKIPSELLFPHLTYWLTDSMVGASALVSEEKDKNGRQKIAGFLKEKAEYYPISNVLKQADKVGKDYYIEGLSSFGWRSADFGIVYPKYEFDISLGVEKNDYIYGGVKVKMSMFGEHALKISAFLLTLVCMNGMISYKEFFTYNRRLTEQSTDEFVYDGMNAAIGALDKEVEKVKSLKSVPVDHAHIIPYVESMFDKMGVHKRIRLNILNEIVAKAPKTMYELMNAITAAAHTVENKVDVFNLQLIGGFVSEHSSTCVACHRPL